jgi:hypothetical protein
MQYIMPTNAEYVYIVKVSGGHYSPQTFFLQFLTL